LSFSIGEPKLDAAVAENQPDRSNQNRMSNANLSPLSRFAARLRDGAGSVAFSRDEAEFYRFALDLFALQFEHNPVYRQFCLARQVTPEVVSDWRDVPSMPTASFKELEVTSLPAAQRIRVFQSSGTTQQSPSRHFHSAESLELYEASLLAWFPAHLLRPGGFESLGLHSLTPRSDEAPTSSLVHMFETLARRFAPGNSRFTGRVSSDGGWEVDLTATLAALDDAIGAKRPLIMLGTAFGFVQLLDHVATGGKRLKLQAGSRVLETGGYKGRSRELPKKELHGLISKTLGVQSQDIVCEYGMSELSSQAYNTPSTILNRLSSSLHFPPWVRVQIVSPETGKEVSGCETGLIRVFDLANVWSVMAIQTEDLGIPREDGFELIGRAPIAEPRGCSLMSA
jgi:hypothetical protein